MGRETTLFSSKEPKSRADVASFLHDLANRIEQGEIKLRRGSDEIRFDLADQVILELKLEDEEKRHKGIRHSFEVELKWYDESAHSGPVELG
ncbi:MAG: amphi-Trp domain-containing protein [Gammaproteobacteria bacterium]|nr:MAG: amphi-Trp domain-containing protein [Gammaproteobacteria bacterium]